MCSCAAKPILVIVPYSAKLVPSALLSDIPPLLRTTCVSNGVCLPANDDDTSSTEPLIVSAVTPAKEPPVIVISPLIFAADAVI